MYWEGPFRSVLLLDHSVSMTLKEIQNELGPVRDEEIVIQVVSVLQSTKKHLFTAGFNDKTRPHRTIQILT